MLREISVVVVLAHTHEYWLMTAETRLPLHFSLLLYHRPQLLVIVAPAAPSLCPVTPHHCYGINSWCESEDPIVRPINRSENIDGSSATQVLDRQCFVPQHPDSFHQVCLKLPS